MLRHLVQAARHDRMGVEPPGGRHSSSGLSAAGGRATKRRWSGAPAGGKRTVNQVRISYLRRMPRSEERAAKHGSIR